ncbi:MAG: 5-formyltetrahydrofolate cyclo-ligase family protein [Planctomycetota bacterium]
MFLHITTRIEGRKNDDLLQKKGGRGFPHLVWLDSNGDVLAKQNGRSVDAFKKSGNAVKAWVDLKAKFDGGDTSVATDLFLAELDLGKHEYEAAKTKAATLTLSEEQQKKVDAALFNLEVDFERQKLPRLRRGATAEQVAAAKEKVMELAAKFEGYFNAGKFPTDDLTAYYFCQPIMQKAMQTKDAALFEKVLVRLKQQAGKNPMFARAWPQWDQQLQSLKAAGGGGEDGGMGGGH